MDQIRLLERQIKKALDEGKRPELNIDLATEIKMPRRPRRGRPRIYPPGTPAFLRYIGSYGRSRPICLAKGCHKFLRQSQRAVCSQECADKIFNHCILLLQKLGITREEIIMHFPESQHESRNNDNGNNGGSTG